MSDVGTTNPRNSRSINPSPASLGKSLSLKYSGYWRISFKPSLVHVPRTCSAAARARRGPARLPASAALPGPLEVKRKYWSAAPTPTSPPTGLTSNLYTMYSNTKRLRRRVFHTRTACNAPFRYRATRRAGIDYSLRSTYRTCSSTDAPHLSCRREHGLASSEAQLQNVHE